MIDLVTLFRNNTNLQESQIKNLLNIKFEDKKLISTEDRWFVLEVVNMIKMMGYPKTYEYLQNSSYKTRREFLENSEILENSRKRNYIDKMINLRRQIRLKGMFKCNNCGSDNTKHLGTLQIRSADEPTTDKYECLDCGTKGSKT